LSKSDEAILGVFERKILKAIFGPTNDNREWRIKYNNELYTGCPRRNVPDFGRVFLMLKYTDITQNTYIQS
jgi:hypothetical protein